MYWLVENNTPVKKIKPFGDYRPDPEGPTYPSLVKLTEGVRNSLGIYPESNGTKPDTKYYTFTTETSFDGTHVNISYTNVVARDIDKLKVDLKNKLANHRYNIETGNIAFNTKVVSTNRETQSTLRHEFQEAKADTNYTVEWKMLDGTFVTLNATQIINAATKIKAHVQSTFKAEKAHLAVIDALTVPEDVINYDVTTDIVGFEWPENPVSE